MHELVQAIREDKADSEFNVNVPVTVYGGNEALDLEADNVDVHFEVLMDYRSWGIKDMVLSVTKDLTVQVYDASKGADAGVIQVPASAMELSYRKGGFWGVEGLDITLGSDGDFKSAVLNCIYCAPTEELI